MFQQFNVEFLTLHVHIQEQVIQSLRNSDMVYPIKSLRCNAFLTQLLIQKEKKKKKANASMCMSSQKHFSSYYIQRLITTV